MTNDHALFLSFELRHSHCLVIRYCDFVIFAFPDKEWTAHDISPSTCPPSPAAFCLADMARLIPPSPRAAGLAGRGVFYPRPGHELQAVFPKFCRGDACGALPHHDRATHAPSLQLIPLQSIRQLSPREFQL